MRKIILYMTMTFDGYLTGPNNELDWFTPGQDDEMNKDTIEILHSADTGLMGYPTGPGMIAYWKDVKEKKNSPKWMMDIAEAITGVHTIIVSNKHEELSINNTELLLAKNHEELVREVNKIKEGRTGGNIAIPGGVRTAQNFSRLGLVDEYILMVHPVAIGEGKRLFTGKTSLELVSAKTYKSGVIQVRYRPRSKDIPSE